MSTLYNKAIKQQQMLRRDLEKFASAPQESPLSLHGQISATLTSFARTVDSYVEAASNEVDPSKARQVQDRIAAFREEIASSREKFKALKAQREESAAASRREELFSRRPKNSENPYESGMGSGSMNSSVYGRGSGHGASGGILGNRQGMNSGISRAQGLSREQDVFGAAGRQLDELLEQGRAAFGDISGQNQMLRSTQQTMLKVAATMGISRETVARVERRVKGDKLVFYGGLIVLAVLFYLILRWLR